MATTVVLARTMVRLGLGRDNANTLSVNNNASCEHLRRITGAYLIGGQSSRLCTVLLYTALNI